MEPLFKSYCPPFAPPHLLINVRRSNPPYFLPRGRPASLTSALLKQRPNSLDVTSSLHRLFPLIDVFLPPYTSQKRRVHIGRKANSVLPCLRTLLHPIYLGTTFSPIIAVHSDSLLSLSGTVTVPSTRLLLYSTDLVVVHSLRRLVVVVLLLYIKSKSYLFVCSHATLSFFHPLPRCRRKCIITN